MLSKSASKGFSLRENCRLRILKDMLSALKDANPNVPNYILVVDDVTTRIISSTLKMIELLEESVLALEKLELVRKPFPKMHVIYFITPTENSINKLCDDFKDAKKPAYGNVHVYLTNHLEQPLMDKLTKQPNLLARLVTFKELNLDFLCPEESVFHFDMPKALPTIFSKFGLKEERALSDLIADKLATVVPCLFDYKNIHIVYNHNENNSIAEKVAKRVHQRIEKFLQLKKDDDEDENPAPIKIIILDRSFDPLTPILHDYYYQAMCFDLLKLEKGIVEYDSTDNAGNTTKKKAMLTDSDDLWNKYKYKHIAEAMQGVGDEFSHFVETNQTTKAQKDMSNLDLKAMSEIVKNMPIYNELMSKYTLHMNLIEMCLKEFTRKEIKDIGEIEQCLATGIDGQGKSVSNQKVVSMIAQKMAMGKLEDEEKLRLILIAAIALELVEKDRKALTSNLTSDDQALLTKLVWLGVDPQKLSSSKGKTSKKGDAISEKAKNRLKNISFDLCRHIPQLENVANEIISNKFDKSHYGSLFIPKNYDGSLGQRTKISAGQIASLKKTGTKNYETDEKNRPKLIFFVIGGISYPEIRVLREFENSNAGVDVIAGSTSIITPMEYIDGIRNMVTTSEYSELKSKDS